MTPVYIFCFLHSGLKENALPSVDQISSLSLSDQTTEENGPFSKDMALTRVRFSPVPSSRLCTISSFAESSSDKDPARSVEVRHYISCLFIVEVILLFLIHSYFNFSGI